MKTSTQKLLSGIVGKIGIVSLIAIYFALFNSSVKAQQTLLVNYDFATAVAGTPCMATPLTAAANVTSIFTSGGANGGTCLTYPGSAVWNSEIGYAFAQTEDGNLSISAGSSAGDSVGYFQFQLSGVSSFHSYKLYFQRIRSNAIDIQYSTDGINFTSFKKIPASLLADYFPRLIIDLSSITAIYKQPTVYFRLEGIRYGISPQLIGLTIDNFQVQATAATKSRKRVRFF
jgi:hypothetical protein